MRAIDIEKPITPGLPGFVVISHGPLAGGLIGSLKLIMGEAENVVSFELEEGDDPASFAKEVIAAYERMPEGSLFLVDIFGGTPFNVILEYFLSTGAPIRAVCGMNLGMLMEGISSRSEDEDVLPKLEGIGRGCVIDVGREWTRRAAGGR